PKPSPNCASWVSNSRADTNPKLAGDADDGDRRLARASKEQALSSLPRWADQATCPSPANVAAISRNLNFWILPDGVRGISATSSSRSGQYGFATPPAATNRVNTSGVASSCRFEKTQTHAS